MATIVFVALAAIATLHVAWGVGMRWPAANERDLVATVVGKTGLARMPGFLKCLGAGAAIFVAGLVALAAAEVVTVPLPPVITTVIAMTVAAVFAGRGAATYLPAWRRSFAQEPFATADQRFYGPFLLLLSAAFLLLVFKRVGMWP